MSSFATLCKRAVAALYERRILKRFSPRQLFAAWLCWLVVSAISPAATPQPCRILVIEKDSGWPVPLVQLRTTHHAEFVTDNAGVIAFDLPELMGRETWFEVAGDGYEVPKDGFGYRGIRLQPQPGKTLRIEVQRTMLARRMGRLTGGGLFGESQKLDLETDWLDSGILGCDSIQNAVHAGRLFWFWGDTTMANYPLGIYAGTGATTSIQSLGSLEPPVRLTLGYFEGTNGQPRGIAPMPGPGPTWISGVVSLPDRDGKAHLVCTYVKIKQAMESYEWGLAVWNETNKIFEPLKTLWSRADAHPKPPLVLSGHAVAWADDKGKKWILFGNPFPEVRCPATFEAWQNPATWEKLKPQAVVPAANGEKIKPHSGSIAWNGFRKRWVTVFMQTFGHPSAFGELWYAEAASPSGPWGPAVKILSHENYTFYNPRLHPEFSPDGSPVLFFEGTYTAEFANHPTPTPRYDYNQILYRLDLDDPRFKPAGGSR